MTEMGIMKLAVFGYNNRIDKTGALNKHLKIEASNEDELDWMKMPQGWKHGGNQGESEKSGSSESTTISWAAGGS